VRLEGLGQLKNPMTSSGIKPTTFQLVVKFYIHVGFEVLTTIAMKSSVFWNVLSCSSIKSGDVLEKYIASNFMVEESSE
jgi:hypothetical protein